MFLSQIETTLSSSEHVADEILTQPSSDKTEAKTIIKPLKLEKQIMIYASKKLALETLDIEMDFMLSSFVRRK